MSEWKDLKLSEIIDILGGGTPKTNVSNYWHGNIPWLSVADFNTGRKFVFETEKSISQEGYDNCSTNYLNKGDIIISARGTVGAVAVLGRSMTFNQSCYGVKAKDQFTFNDFLYYLLKYSVADFQQIAHGGVFDTITRNTFNEIEVSLPPLIEQQAITSVLSSLDDKIDLLHRQNETLEKMAETLFRKWFVEDGKDKWESSKIGLLLDTILGGTPSTQNPDYWGGNIPWINSGEVNNFRILKASKYITDLGLKKSNTKLLPKGTTVLAITGATLGQISMLEIDTCANQSVVGIIPNNIIPKEYIYLWIKYKINEIILSETGGAQPHINKNDINETDIKIPGENDLLKLRLNIAPLFDKITINSFQIITLTQMRDILLPKLLNGEISVKIN